MASSVHVERLGLKLVTPGSMRAEAPALQSRIEGQFVPALLRAMVRHLGRRFGDKAVIRIRSLRIKCGLRADEPDSGRLAEQLGQELAQQISGMAPGRTRAARSGPASAMVQIFRDRAQWQAARLIAAARGRRGPAGKKEDFGRLWTEVRRTSPAARLEVLRRALEEGGLEAMLARLDVAAIAALEPIAASGASAAIRAVLRRALADRLDRGEDAVPPSMAREEPAEPPAPAGEPPERQAPASGEGPAAAAPATEQGKRRARRAKAALRAPATLPPRARRPSPDGQRRARPRRRTGPPPAGQDLAPRRAVGEPAELSDARPLAAEPAEPREEIAPIGRLGFPSRWCGLLFLVNVSQRLELPERLWQIGVDEGAVLATAFARLAGSGDDPAPRILSRAFPGPPPSPLPPVPDWAREELATGLDRAAARLLGEAADGEALRARIAALEREYGEGGGFDLAGWCVAAHLAVAEAMLGPAIPPGALAPRLAIAGRIEAEEDSLRVVLPMEAIDVDLRRAGLDADPGWLAWLGKRLSFVFEGGEA